VGICLLVLLGGTVGALGFVGSADAAPPPRPVCASCGDAFEDRATDVGVTLTVENSTATVTVHRNGTGSWVVRNRLAAGASVDRLRENATLRSELADAHYWDVEVISTAVTDDGTFTARYRDPDFARTETGDTLVSRVFTHEYGYRNLDGLGADRLTVVAPDGMTVAQTVPGATRTSDGTRTVLTHYDRGGFVTFVPEGAALGPILGWLAIAAILGPVVVVNAGVGILVPAVVVGGVVGASGRLLFPVFRAIDSLVGAPGRGLAVVGVAGIAGALVAGAAGTAGPLVALLFGVCSVAVIAGVLWMELGPPDLTFRRVVAVSLGGVALATVTTLAGSVLFSGRLFQYGLVARLPTLVALFAFVPAGYAVQRGHLWRGALTAAAGVGVALGLAVPLTTTYSPFRLGTRIVVATASALALAVVGLPLLAVGARLARE
jgi:hypothetical protein